MKGNVSFIVFIFWLALFVGVLLGVVICLKRNRYDAKRFFPPQLLMQLEMSNESKESARSIGTHINNSANNISLTSVKI